MKLLSLVQQRMRRLIPVGFDFTIPFETLAQHSGHAATYLEMLLKNPQDASKFFSNLQGIEKAADDCARVIHERVRVTFVTSFDREDISSLARQLDDVIDLLESAGLNVSINAQTYDGSLAHFGPFLPQTLLQASFLIRATETLPAAINALRLNDAERIHEIQKRIHGFENSGDEIWEQIKRRRSSFLKKREVNSLTGGDMLLILWVEHVCHQLENCLDLVKNTVDHVSDIIAKSN